MTDQTLPPLPTPWDYCYVWNGPYGKRRFTPAPHNGTSCGETVPVFTADQMNAHALAAIARVEAERDAALQSRDDWIRENGRGGWIDNLRNRAEAATILEAERIERIASGWDGCKYEAPGESIDIGAAIRRAAQEGAAK